MLTSESKQRLEGSHGCAAPVEPEDEVVEVVGQVFPTHVAVSVPEARLDVGEDLVDPREQTSRPPSALPGSWARGHTRAA
jgi:hypothetical protein